MKRWLLRGLVVLVIIYCVFLGLMFAAMRKSPTEFSRFMMKLPRPLMYATPFPPMWNKARAGSVNVGDLAPDFELPVQTSAQRVRLSQFRGDRPVLLVFGSYT